MVHLSTVPTYIIKMVYHFYSYVWILKKVFIQNIGVSYYQALNLVPINLKQTGSSLLGPRQKAIKRTFKQYMQSQSCS